METESPQQNYYCPHCETINANTEAYLTGDMVICPQCGADFYLNMQQARAQACVQYAEKNKPKPPMAKPGLAKFFYILAILNLLGTVFLFFQGYSLGIISGSIGGSLFLVFMGRVLVYLSNK